MILFRWAVMRFSERLPAVAPWSTRTEGNVDVAVAHVRNSDSHAAPTSLSFLAPRQMPELEPTEVVILASTEIGVRTRGPFQIEIDDAPRRRAERAISTFAANLGIVAETSWTLSSPNPFLAVAASSEEDRETLHLAERIVLPPPQLAPAFLGTGLGVATDLLHLTDRLDGVRLLGAAVSTTTGVARLHELFRLLENAFACAGERLVTPLERFLKSYPAWDLGYSSSEIQGWVTDLRNPGTHADLRRSKHVAFDSDVHAHLHRITQAAYDVLWNKTYWHSSNSDRTMRWTYRSAVSHEGITLIDHAPIMRLNAPLDHFGTWPLEERTEYIPSTLGDEPLLLGRWHFSDEDWVKFENSSE